MKLLSLLFILCVTMIGIQCSKEANSEAIEGVKSGSITRFAVYNGFMYALNQYEVLTFDLKNPDKPELVHTLKTDYGLETIIAYEGTLFLGSTSSLYILDITKPEAPVILAQKERELIFGRCDPVVVRNDHAYSTVKTVTNVCGLESSISALIVYDVKNKSNPLQVNDIPMSQPNGLGYAGNYLFVCDEGDGAVHVFDITNPENPAYTDYNIALEDSRDLIVWDQNMIVSTKSDFVVYDISDITKIRKLSTIKR